MVKRFVERFLNEQINGESNYISNKIALNEKSKGLKIFNTPLVGYASVKNSLFEKLREERIVGQHFMLPIEWLPEGKSVISMFFPFTKSVREANAKIKDWPSVEWLHGRIEGQNFINEVISLLIKQLKLRGIKAVEPAKDKRFFSKGNEIELKYTSNWSERHVAFVCGLGTFGLSKGLITKKGIAGRFASLIIDKKLDFTERRYIKFDEYCNLCGNCIKNCPVDAISFEQGKDHFLCDSYLKIIKDIESPRYGCGKCQVGVQCEFEIPSKVKVNE